MLAVGSTWRQWDLHIHTPDTILNDQFGDWDEFLTAIEEQDAVKVLGVTDYFSITNYSKLKRYKEDGRLPGIDLLVPNIEFRIAPPSENAKAVNIHLLINPDDPCHENEITNALGRLTWRYGAKNYSCLPDQLVALGRAFDSDAIDDRAALRAGVTQFKVDFTSLRDWYHAEPWLQANSLVAVAAGDDGLSGFHQDGAWAGYREEITRFSQMIFSGRLGEREFWLGRRDAEDLETIKRLGGFKPCIHGSDAHDMPRLFRPDQERYCWIKPTQPSRASSSSFTSLRIESISAQHLHHSMMRRASSVPLPSPSPTGGSMRWKFRLTPTLSPSSVERVRANPHSPSLSLSQPAAGRRMSQTPFSSGQASTSRICT